MSYNPPSNIPKVPVEHVKRSGKKTLGQVIRQLSFIAEAHGADCEVGVMMSSSGDSIRVFYERTNEQGETFSAYDHVGLS